MKRIVLAILLGAILVVAPRGSSAATLHPLAGGQYAGSLELNASAAQLNAWSQPAVSCDTASTQGAKVSVVAGNLDLRVNGGTYVCASVESPQAYLYGVIEYRFYVPLQGGLIANWPAAWLRGGTWQTPSYQELDAFEGLAGHDQTSYWTGNGVAPGDDVTGYSTTGTSNGGGYNSVGIPEVGKPVISGWNTVDVAWFPTGFVVYDNGREFAAVPESEATPMNVILDNTEGPAGLQPTGNHSDFYINYVRVWGYS